MQRSHAAPRSWHYTTLPHRLRQLVRGEDLGLNTMGFDSRSKAAALLDVLHVRLWLSLGCLLFSLSIVSAADVVKQLDVSYGEEIRKLDICIPSSPPLGSILIIHGGGWVAGDKRDDIGLCTLFAKSGILALSVNYTLLDGTTNRWPAPIDDVKAVRSWLLTHA